MGRWWTVEEDKTLEDWVKEHGSSKESLRLLSQKLDRTVNSLWYRGWSRGLWRRQVWQQEEIDRMVAWAKVHGTSESSIRSGLRKMGIDRTFEGARYHLIRQGVLPSRSAKYARKMPNVPLENSGIPKRQTPSDLLPQELLSIYWRLPVEQRKIADSIATYDAPAFVNYVRMASMPKILSSEKYPSAS